MATNYPVNIQDLDATRGTDNQKLSSPSHTTHHTTEDDTIEALQTKVGIDASAVTTTHDYKLSGVTGSDKAVSKTGTETLTNKTLTAPVVTSPVLTVGSDATGDLYYRSAGGFTRLAIGSANHILNVTGGIPAWRAETSLADASTTVKGVVEAATSAEVTAGTATGATGAVLAVTPDALASSTPVFNGSGLTGIVRSKLYITHTDVSPAADTVENDLLTISIPANTLSTNNGIKGRLYYNALQNSSAGTCTIRFKYGSTTIVSNAITVVTSGSALGYIDFYIIGAGTTSAQEGIMEIKSITANATAYATNQNQLTFINTGTAAEVSTGALDLKITVQFSASSGTIVMKNAIVEKIY